MKTPASVERVAVSDLVSADGRYQIRRDATWLYAERSDQRLPDHGWKFHIASRFGDFRELAATLVPVLLEEGCSFKLARSVRVLGEINDGTAAPSSVGKAVTVYPDQERVTRLGRRLAELLRGRVGPRILSDRRVASDAPVYYRYGPFRRTLVANRLGNLATVMVGPDGETFDGWATTSYRMPPWAVDPFRTDDGGAEGSEAATRRPARLGTHYELREGLLESGRGNVYAATDVRTGETVVVKQARAYIAETLDGHDARTQLRNDRFVLSALHDVPGVARFRDHFRHGEDEYLVTSFDGMLTLAEDVTRKGRYAPVDEPDPGAYPPELGESRSLDALAHRLARTLRAIHARGYLLRDLSPKNLIVSDTGDDVTFIDFGHCHHHDVAIPGGTKGYAPARQFDGQPAEPGDDLHALGMTLFATAIGAEPVVDEDDLGASRVMALRVLDRIYADRPPPVIGAVIDLLSAEPETMADAFDALADGRPRDRARAARRHAVAVHRRGPDTATLVDRALGRLVSRADEVCDAADEPDSSVYRGAAGVGLCLLPHLDRPGVADTVARLARFGARSAEEVRLRPGLYLGTTGVELFLRRAIAAGVPATPLSPRRLFGESGDPIDTDDIINGTAGIGLGHLLLNELDPRPEHEDVVRRCAASLEALGDAGHAAANEASIPGRDTTVGVSHGHAGVVEFLRHWDRLEASVESRRRFTAALATLTEQVTRFVDAVTRPEVVPLCTSWCRGMAGMGRVLLAAGRQLGDDSLVEVAVSCADGCLRWLPRLATAGQCCGVAGIGELFCDLIPHDGRFLAAAESAATQMLILQSDAPPAPSNGNLVQPGRMSWASGAAGTLDFLTRLRDLTPRGTATAPF